MGLMKRYLFNEINDHDNEYAQMIEENIRYEMLDYKEKYDERHEDETFDEEE